jgi:hypothetical protein
MIQLALGVEYRTSMTAAVLGMLAEIIWLCCKDSNAQQSFHEDQFS